MKLYDNPASPYCRKVRVLLRETGMADRVQMVAAAGHPTDPGTMPVGLNPLGKIPALERSDGPTLYDSRVICRYLDHLAGHKLYPAPPRLWEALTLEATADGMQDAAVLMVYEGRSRPEDKQDPAWVEGQWAKILRALGALEALWIPHLKGPLDIGVIATGCALGYLDFRHGDRDWRGAHPSLAEWYAGFSARDAMVATAPPTA